MSLIPKSSSESLSEHALDMGKTMLNQAEKGIQAQIDKINASEEPSQVDLIELQSLTGAYTNYVSMLSNILKGLSDSDSEVIRNT